MIICCHFTEVICKVIGNRVVTCIFIVLKRKQANVLLGLKNYQENQCGGGENNLQIKFQNIMISESIKKINGGKSNLILLYMNAP